VKTGYSAKRILQDDENDELGRVDLRLQQAWVLWRPVRPVAIQFGRQDFDEDREWLYDEILDGVRAHAETGALRTELSVSTRWNTSSSALEDWTNYTLLTGSEISRNWNIEAYGVHRRHDARDASPLWLGARSHGRLRSGLTHWLEASSLTGRLDGVDKAAWAADAGLSLRLERRTRWSVTGGLAVGSGGDGPDGTFRQTGFHDNNDRFSGVSSFRYYGELLDPELANLTVATLGTGLRPSRHSSIDFVFHRYTQRRAEARILDTNLERRPRGTDPNLGTEWDVILAFEEIPGLDIEYVLARFTPGEAFDPAADAATLHKLSIRYGF
jgi:alginate production protein